MGPFATPLAKDCLLEQFFLPEGIYLLSHSVGCLPKVSREALEERFFNPWKERGGDAWENWLQILEDFRAALSLLLDAPKEEFCPQTNISSALSKVLHSLPKRKKRRRILVAEDAFPSMGFVLSRMEEQSYEVEYLPRRSSSEDWKSKLGEDVHVAFFTHVTSNESCLLPLKGLLKHCRSLGIFSIVDVAQSAGIIPISLQDWEADFVLGSSVKWLCGGPGACFLWASSKVLDQCQPIDVGWFSHENPFEGNIFDFRLKKDAMRFLGGTPSVAPFAIASKSIEFLHQAGVEEIRKKNLSMLTALRIQVLEKGYTVASPSKLEEGGGTLTIQFDRPHEQVPKLKELGIAFDLKEGNLARFSPHIYNSPGEMEEVCKAL